MDESHSIGLQMKTHFETIKNPLSLVYVKLHILKKHFKSKGK